MNDADRKGQMLFQRRCAGQRAEPYEGTKWKEMAALKLKDPVLEGRGVGRVRGAKSFWAFGKWQRQGCRKSKKIK